MRPGHRSLEPVTEPLSEPTPNRSGLRERKKAAMRLRISDLATGMFLERGFDEVTVAEVAEAANVSVKTVFNYFGSKEDLLFDREPEWLASIDQLASMRAPGRGLIRVLQADLAVRWPALEFGRWDALTPETLDGRRRFFQLIANHSGLQARLRQMGERIGERIAAVVATDFDEGDSIEASTAGALVHTAYSMPGRELTRQLLQGAPAAVIVERSKAIGFHALGLLEQAYTGTRLVEGPPD